RLPIESLLPLRGLRDSHSTWTTFRGAGHRPDKLFPQVIVDDYWDWPDGAGEGYMSNIRDLILDQFGNAPPRKVAANEKFTTGIVEPRDWVGSDWPLPREGAYMQAPNELIDHVGRRTVAGNIPQSSHPGRPDLGNTTVDHWTQEWRIGS